MSLSVRFCALSPGTVLAMSPLPSTPCFHFPCHLNSCQSFETQVKYSPSSLPQVVFSSPPSNPRGGKQNLNA